MISIHAYSFCYNDEKILPYFLRHYESFCSKIVIFDNGSTDSSHSIISKCPIAELRFFDTDNYFDILGNLKIKNSAYKESRGQADFVISVDLDEIVYHSDISEVLETYLKDKITVVQTCGYGMISENFPTTSNQIYTEIKYGVRDKMFDKSCIFSPDVEMNFYPGSHRCSPSGEQFFSSQDIKLLHYSHLGIDYVVEKYNKARSRIEKKGRQKSYGHHYFFSRSHIDKCFNEMLQKKQMIINNEED